MKKQKRNKSDNGRPRFNWAKVPNVLVGGIDCPYCGSWNVADWSISINNNAYRRGEDGKIEWFHKITYECAMCGKLWQDNAWLPNE